MHHTDKGWQPTKVIRIGEAEATSTGVTRVMTDAGLAFCKPIGNRQGEQVLASEWVCLKLAKWLGLPTFRAAIIYLTEDATFDLPEHKGTQFRAKAGPCFLTESTPGRQWSKDPAELETLVNTEDLTKLVAFDTWVLNRDRHYPDYTVRKPNYGNVFLVFVEGKPEHARLVAMDHTHCFDNGQLHAKLSNIDFVKDDRIYGLFPEFVAHMSLITLAGVSAQLRTLASADVKTILDEVPTEWQVDAAARKAWSELILARASFVADELPKKLGAEQRQRQPLMKPPRIVDGVERMKGYYSVIQYCPDLSRAEAANVGVMLFIEQPHKLAVKVSETFARVERFFKPNREQLAHIVNSTRSTATRLNLSVEELVTIEELENFRRTMGNDIRMTAPRVVVVDDIEKSLLGLYAELVGDSQPARSRRAVVLPTPINRVFEQLTENHKVWSPGKVKVPLIGRTIDIPYAYRNGIVNYVKPAIFADDTHVDGKAARLAIEGDQLRKHPEEDVAGKTHRQLVVVSAAASDSKIESRVAPVFAAYGVIYIPKDRADQFAQKVLLEAK